MTVTKPSHESYAVEFRNVSISFGAQPVLSDVSFKLRSGGMLILTGESGSGKSVLLRLAMGLEKPDAGQIFINGRDISSLGESDLLAIRGGLMGMVFQEDSLFTGLSVYDNVAFRLAEHGWSEEDIDKAVNEVLRFVGLDGEQEKLPEELSGGMKRRLEIARALVGWPSIMLFDEPTMSLDPIVALQVIDLVIRARDINHISSIYVTKKPMEISYLAGYAARARDKGIVVVEASAEELPDTTIIVLEKGRIVFTGSLASFESSNLSSVRRMITLHPQHDELDIYFKDPWDKSRVAREKLL
ncbi:MAG TPA: ATP-binding cassette domain-containing protein [Pyrinomonadaceae bacterium]|nr:ATP-binding cassette domain-containing protein [Pyrinomonadaceae bacterium]